MLRFLCHLLGRPFEPCKSCETLKEQLSYLRDENHRLTDTLINIVKPKEIEAQAPIEINQIQQSSALFSKRRAALEERDRQEAKILAEKKFVGVSDRLREVTPTPIVSGKTVDELEKELGVEGEGA